METVRFCCGGPGGAAIGEGGAGATALTLNRGLKRSVIDDRRLCGLGGDSSDMVREVIVSIRGLGSISCRGCESGLTWS